MQKNIAAFIALTDPNIATIVGATAWLSHKIFALFNFHHNLFHFYVIGFGLYSEIETCEQLDFK